jgi:hypothetical protein
MTSTSRRAWWRSNAGLGAELLEQGTKTHQSRRVSLDPRTVEVLASHLEELVEMQWPTHGQTVPADLPPPDGWDMPG